MSRQQRVFLLVIFAITLIVYSSFVWVTSNNNPTPELMPTLAEVASNTTLATPVPDVVTVASTNPLTQTNQTIAVSNPLSGQAPSDAFIVGDRPAPVTSAPVPNQQVLAFAPYTSPMEQEAYLQSIGATVIHRIDSLNTVIVQVERRITPDRTAEMRLLVSSEPDYYLNAQISGTPNDPLFADQWALPAASIPQAWSQLPTNTTPVTVAVIDSGVCANHSDLSGRILQGMSFVVNDASVEDTFGHGCSIIGAIAANIDNAAGIAGVAPNAQILPLRVLDGRGIGTYSAVAAAMVFATDNGAQIINLSLGGGSASNLLESAVEYATGRGVTVIAAAGNQGSSRILYPAAYPAVIAVGAIERDLSVSSFSNYGATVDIYAPGHDILTLGLNNTTTSATGTSIATALATGVAALEKAFGRELALGGVLSFNRTTVVDIAEPNKINLVTIAPEVREAIARDGSAQVMIALNLPINAQDDTASAQAIAVAQSEVLAQLAPEEFTLAHQFIYTPGLAGTINADGLAALTLNSQIANIYLDEPMEAASIRSVNNIGVPALQTGAVNGLNLTGAGVTVAVLDSGITMSNAAVSGDVVAQQCFSSKGRCPGDTTRADIAPDESLHGTNVSAIITDPQGVAPDAKIAALKVLDKFGTGTSSDWIAALDWIKNQALTGGTKVDVVNMSLGSLKLYKANTGSGATNCDSFYVLEAAAVQNVLNLGIPIVAATGNQGSKDSINSPACLSGVIAVGAIYDTIMGSQPPTGTYYSHFEGNWPKCVDATTSAGQVTCFSNSSAWVDVVAPGADIVIGLTGASGTSQASPHVAGVVALMIEGAKKSVPAVTYSPAKITSLLRTTGATVTDNGLTFRSLDAFDAVDALINPTAFISCAQAEIIGTSEATCNALVSLYESTAGNTWVTRTGWMRTNRPCTWFGVTCDGSGVVTGLALPGNNLVGSISPDLATLTSLQGPELKL